MPTNARSCKHLRELLGDAYEDARLLLKNPDGDTNYKTSKSSGAKKAPAEKKPPSRRAPARGKRKNDEREEVDDEDDVEVEAKPAKRARTTAKGKARETMVEPKEDEGMDVDEEKTQSAEIEQSSQARSDEADDELASINGLKPKQVILEGEEIECKSQTRYVRCLCLAKSYLTRSGRSRSVYKVKRTFDHYYWYVLRVSLLSGH
jgi:DNA ligase-1